MTTIKKGSFPQRMRSFYPTDCPVTSICFCETVWAGTQDGLLALRDGAWECVLQKTVDMLFGSEDFLLVGSGSTLYRIEGGKPVSEETLQGTVQAADRDGTGKIFITTDQKFYLYKDGKCSLYSRAGDGGVYAMTAFGSGEVYLAAEGFLYGLHGKRPRWSEICRDNSDMPDAEIRDLAADPWGHIYLATDKGVVLYDARSRWYTPEQLDALPRGDIRKVVIAADGTRCFGTANGLIVQDGVRESFLGAERWLPGGEVTALCAADGKIYVGTKCGLTVLQNVPMTLAEKAAIYEKSVEQYHVREGYVTVRRLSEKDNIASGHVEISDNDGLWTGFYLGAQAMRYAVTGEPEALAHAKRAKNALLKLLTCTGIPGFPARAYRRPGEDRFGNGDPEWHLIQDEKGALEWKGETSSDEVVGHVYGLSFYYDLCADAAEKQEIADALCAVADHILRNSFTLCDSDGLPTTWAHWGPEELNHDDIWFWERGINSMELLSILRTAMHMRPSEAYTALYRELVTKHHYALNCMQIKIDDCHVNHIDDNLGFLTYAVLLRYEDDPYLRQIFLAGMRQHWQIERKERCPMWNLIYGAMSGDLSCDLDAAVRSLCELPTDLICYKTVNSHRPGLRWSSGQERFGGEPQLCEPLPYDEKPITKYDNNPFLPDGGSGMWAADGTLFLAPYWYGRYYGLIGE